MNIRSPTSAGEAGAPATQVQGVRDSGGDGDPIILLHGFLTSSAYWNRVRPHLTAAGYRVIAIDLLGFGDAPKPRNSQYGYREHLAHLEKVVAGLALTKQPVLVGHSLGAMLAARHAARNGDRVRSLVLLHPPLYQDIVEARAALRDTGRVYRFLLDSRHRQLSWGLARALPVLGVAPHSQISRERTLRNLIEASEIFSDLRGMATPTLLVLGLRDRPQYGANLEAAVLSERVTVASVDTSHHSPLTRPRWVSDAVAEFAKGDAEPASSRPRSEVA